MIWTTNNKVNLSNQKKKTEILGSEKMAAKWKKTRQMKMKKLLLSSLI